MTSGTAARRACQALHGSPRGLGLTAGGGRPRLHAHGLVPRGARPGQRPLHRGADPAATGRDGRPDHRGLRGPRPARGRRPARRGDGDGRPGAGDAAAPGDGLDGGQLLRLGHQVQRRGPHPQGPRHRHQRSRRADRRRDHRHRPDAELAGQQPLEPQPRERRDRHPAAQARGALDARGAEVHRLGHPQRVRRRLRPRLPRALPQPARHRHPRAPRLLLIRSPIAPRLAGRPASPRLKQWAPGGV